MNTERVDPIVNAVLYEGYLLYPYRRCLKNERWWLFGTAYPRTSGLVRTEGERCSIQTECLVVGTVATKIEVQMRFLHLLDHSVVRISDRAPGSGSPRRWAAQQLEYLREADVDGTHYETWQEGIERRIEAGCHTLADLIARPERFDFSCPGLWHVHPIYAGGEPSGVAVIRRQESLVGAIECSARQLGEGIYSLLVRADNVSELCEVRGGDQPDSQRQAFLSTHTLLHVTGGEFQSLTDPPQQYREAVGELRNDGTWPVLVGDEGLRNMILSSPIVLYDFPQVAAESPGDLFDGTEIDEILSLRIMTLSADEQRRLQAADQRARKILERTASLPAEHFSKLHGATRALRRCESAPE